MSASTKTSNRVPLGRGQNLELVAETLGSGGLEWQVCILAAVVQTV